MSLTLDFSCLKKKRGDILISISLDSLSSSQLTQKSKEININVKKNKKKEVKGALFIWPPYFTSTKV